MPRSLVPPASTRLTGRQVDGAPVYAYVRSPDTPPVSVLRFGGRRPAVGDPADDHAHAHDFLVLAYYERGRGAVRLDDRAWPLEPGDAFVIAPGEVVRMVARDHLHEAAGWAVFFPPEVIGSAAPGGLLTWRTHPLLFPFVGRGAGGAQRLRVPPAERAAWAEHAAMIERELADPRDGSSEAVMARLTLLLVSVSRIAVDLGDDFRLRDEPLLAAVFEFIEQRYAEPISLADAARAVGLTPGHLTTVVRRKTGRTVQQWLAERRMVEARRLLRQTDLTVEAIAARTGHRHTSFFIKQFRRDHRVTPAVWRRQARASRSRPAA
ncbi:MAG TPA: AraC family transcriptional regulator [Solirubrobacteraceae bacterium]|jgi:AraC-like DNA-binding protein|nr:AraC family transcriptional regulator [Solirubrobacteraceae bacterium]